MIDVGRPACKGHPARGGGTPAGPRPPTRQRPGRVPGRGVVHLVDQL